MTLGGQTFTASFLMARAAVVCRHGKVTGSGVSQVVNLTVNGQSIVVTGQPNQVVILPNVGSFTINEQIYPSGYMIVRALHVSIPGNSADVVVSEARAGMMSGKIVCDASNDFVTGGGWIVGTPSGSRGTFGVAGGINSAGFWGHLTYVDHGSGQMIKGTGVTSYVLVNSTTRHIEGACEIDGQPGTYEVDITDNGEPGGSDTIVLTLSNGYQASGTLNGGNIQLHVACR